MRKDFDLPEDDEQFLDRNNYKWETIIEKDTNWLIIRDFPIINGYNVRNSDAAIKIPSQYPDSKLDMVNFYPHFSRNDKIGMPNVGDGPIIEEKKYQQWSRHREWRIGIDSLENHIEEVHYWLENEFNKRPKQNAAA
jgi:hypothetical protein